MDKPKHTPGPWGTAGNGCTTALHIYAGSDRESGGTGCIATVHAVQGDSLANARLIAAAPEMLDALRETLRALEAHLDESCRDHGLGHRDMLCPCNQNEVMRARLAIRKATGEE